MMHTSIIILLANVRQSCDEVKESYQQSDCCAASPDTVTNLETFQETYLRITNAPPLWYPGSPGAQDGGFLDRANNEIPLLPNQHGYMLTSGTPRFLSVVEQQLTVTGESKHGLWRIQENGFIREYRVKQKRGLYATDEMRARDPTTVTPALRAILENEYTAFDETVGFGGGMDSGGYRPWPGMSDKVDPSDNTLTFIDLPIHHQKYAGKYENHVPIDLPSYFCTMSAGNVVGDISTQFWEYAIKQPGANEIGDLGKRAGLDIRELHPDVIRLHHMPDAAVWANVGMGKDSDFLSQTRWDSGERTQTMNYQKIDTDAMPVEYYLYMRPFFNIKYLFITAVFDNTPYIRPDGLYYRHIQERVRSGLSYAIPTVIPWNPKFPVKYYDREGDNVLPINGMRGYGIHHNNRKKFGHAGSQCPDKGGDWGTWPYGQTQGGGWPTQYQEIGPMCDAIIADLRFYAQLGVPDKSAPKYYLPNANQGTNILPYHLDRQKSGEFTDPYLIANNITNLHAFDTTIDSKVVEYEGSFEITEFFLDFEMQGHYAPAVHTASSFGLRDKNALQALPIAPGQLNRQFSVTFLGTDSQHFEVTIQYSTVQFENFTDYILTVDCGKPICHMKPKFRGFDVVDAATVQWRLDHVAAIGGTTTVLSGNRTNNYLMIDGGWCSALKYDEFTRICKYVDFKYLVLDP